MSVFPDPYRGGSTIYSTDNMILEVGLWLRHGGWCLGWYYNVVLKSGVASMTETGFENGELAEAAGSKKFTFIEKELGYAGAAALCSYNLFHGGGKAHKIVL